jgi:hypothetical protein
MISYVFPPEGSAGTYRPLRFVRHLPTHGWRPVVIASKPHLYERYDPELLKLVPPLTEIVRVRHPDKWLAFQQDREHQYRKSAAAASVESLNRIKAAEENPTRSILRNVIHRLEGIVYHPDPYMLWIRPATNAAVQACAKSGAEVVWATGAPWSSFVVARNVSLRTGRPYILDFRDSWTLLQRDGFYAAQPEWARAHNRRLLSSLFHGARAVVFRYGAEAESYWCAYPGALAAERIHIIPNGYDGSIGPFEVSQGDRCKIIYTGYMMGYWYETVLEALAALKRSKPDVAHKLRVVFVGEGTEAVVKAVANWDLTDIVETSGAVSYSEINRLQQEAHALLLLGWKPGGGQEFGGSKIFGYIKARRPIVGILPDDENRRILRSMGVRTVADAGSLSEIINLFQLLVDAWESGNLPSLLPNQSECERYSAEQQTSALARALEGLPALEPFVPGVYKIPASLQGFIGPEGWVSRSLAFSKRKHVFSRVVHNANEQG